MDKNNGDNQNKDNELSVHINTNIGNYVVQSNDLILSRQELSATSAKIIRLAIMQIGATDEELKPYVITIPELASLLKIDKSNLYKDIDHISDEIMKNQISHKEVVIDKKGNANERFVKINWVSICVFDRQLGLFSIKLSEALKPFLIGLKDKGYYNTYFFYNILMLKKIWSIRLYEVLTTCFKKTNQKIVVSTIPVDTLKDYFGIEKGQYSQYSNFRIRCIEPAISEINEYTDIEVSFKPIQKGKAVEKLEFTVKRRESPILKELTLEDNEKTDSQKTLEASIKLEKDKLEKENERRIEAVQEVLNYDEELRELALQESFIEKYAKGIIKDINYIKKKYGKE